MATRDERIAELRTTITTMQTQITQREDYSSQMWTSLNSEQRTLNALYADGYLSDLKDELSYRAYFANRLA